MPVMPRSKNKATKIAYSILGKPNNMDTKKTKMQRKLDHQLTKRSPIY